MKKILTVLLLTSLTTFAFAEDIHLKNGKSVSGTILEQTDKSVKVDVQGSAITYYMDEIQDINGIAIPEPTKIQDVLPPVEAVNKPIESSSKKDLILKFIDVFGTREAMTSNIEAMLNGLPADNPESKRMREAIKIEEIIDRLVPVYDKQFSEEDLNAFIAFYSSSAGRKLLEGIPAIMRQSVAVSTGYFQEKFPELQGNNKK